MQLYFEVKINDDGKKLGAFLRGRGMSASLVRSVKFLPLGITVSGEQAFTDRVMRAGETVTVRLPDSEPSVTPSDFAEPSLLYESGDALVLDKPAGMVTHPTRGHAEDTLANAYAAMMAKRGENAAFRPVFRLDRDTTGCLLAAKNRYAAPLLADSCQKTYIAVAEKAPFPLSGRIDAPIGPAPGSIIKRTVAPDGKPAATLYRTIGRIGECAVLELKLETGRTHQIRVHLAHIGCPLAGDTLYGGGTSLIARQALHCARIEFDDPLCGHTVVVSPLLPDMQALVDKMERIEP